MLKREKAKLLVHFLKMAGNDGSVPVGPGLPNVPRQPRISTTSPAGPATGRGHRRRVPGRTRPTLDEALSRALAWARKQ